MDRSGARLRLRGISPVVVVVTVLTLVAGALTAVDMPGSPHGGLSVQAAGSAGSLRHYSWWDPRGWFGGGGGAPSTHVIADYKPAAGRPPGRVAGQGAHQPAHRVRRLPAQDGYTQVYQMSDGTQQAVVSAGPVNYRAPSGAWAPVSTAVRPSGQHGYSYQNTTNTFQSFFGSAAGQLVRFDAPGGGWVTIGISGARSVRPVASGDTVTYAGVAPGVSLSYEVTSQSLTEKITLASAAAASLLASLRFSVRTGGGLSPVTQRDGSIALTRDGVAVLTLPAPFMTDSRPDASSPYGLAWSPKVAQHVSWDAATSTLGLSLSADAGWLGQSARKYPVVIDPTIVVSPTPADAQNVMIESDAATTNFSSIYRLSVGTSAAGVERSLLSFPLGAVPSNTSLTSASLKLYYDQTFGPGTANQTVQVDQAKAAWSASTATWSNANNNVGTAGPSVTVNPATDNIWDSFTVTSIVQSWLSGTAANDGFVVKATNESTLNVGGPRYEASFNGYNGEVVTYPQLVLTYGIAGVTPNPITTIHATGAQLSWSTYSDPTPSSNTGDDIASYQVYRSVFQSFIPGANTLIATVPATSTSFTDTTNTPTPPGGLGNAFYYMIAVKTKDGTVIPGPVQLVRLPTAGSTVQIINASSATSLSSSQPTTVEQHITGQPWTSVGDDSATFGTTRSLFAFPAMASAGVPSDATVSEAHLKLWGFYNDSGSPTAAYDAYELTQSFTASQATWNSAATGTPWTTAGGTYSSTLQSQVTDLLPDPSRHNWAVTSAVQDWVNTPADEHGLIVKLDSSAIAERELFTDTTASEPALRPELVVTYSEPTAADTYYAPSLPSPMASNTSYTVPVTLTNTTASTWSASDWVLDYHWLTPDGTDVSASSDQVQTALPASMAPSSVATVNASVKTPDTSASGDARAGYQLAWDLFDKTTGTWLSSGTSTPVLTAAGATRLGATGASARSADAFPMAQGNNTVATLKQAASVDQPSSDLLGLEKFYQYTGINTGAGGSLLNNADAGNVVWNYNAFTNPSRGFQTFVRLSYNSMDTSESSMGFGWSLQASSLMRLGTPLDFLPNPHPTTVKLTDGDGTGHLFTLNSTTGLWQSPPGVHYYLQQIADCTPNGKDPIAKAWLMTAPDRTEFWFDCQGYQTAVVDKNGNEADFSYTQRNSNNQPVKFLDYITDPTGRQTLTISYYAKGDTYNYIDANGNVASGTNLTNPDIIDMVKSITDISGRTITFLYNVQGEMAQMTDGDGTSIAKVFKFGYDPTQGNKNVKLVSVTDPRGNTTNLSYYTAPQDPKFKWSLNTITDRRGGTNSFAYAEEAGGTIQTVATDPNGHASTYVLDATGRPTQSTDALGHVTKLAWDSDNNVTSLTEDNGAVSTWTYDPNTGYPLSQTDAQANKNGTAGTTYTYQTGLNGHIADLIAKLSPQQRLWTFGYDTNGNLTSVTDPDGNAVSPPSGYTTKYTYDGTGLLQTTTDANGNKTAYSNYDPNGYPQTITDALGNASTYVYDVRGNVTKTTDPLGHTTTQAYDVFARPGQRVVAQDQANGVYVTTPAPVYDANDDITQQTAANGAVTTYTFDPNDELIAQYDPQDTAASPQRKTTYTYDPAGNKASMTEPDGNVANPVSSFTTTYAYDVINELTSQKDAAGNTISYGYDDVGNQTSVTDPLGHVTKYGYDLDQRQTSITDAAGYTASEVYDRDGQVISTTDQNGNTTLYTLDPHGDLTQQEVPFTSSGGTTTYDVTQYVYDQDHNKIKTITPRGVASGITNAFTQQIQYDADNRIKAQLSAYNPNDPIYNTPAETDYTYDAAGRATQVSAPPSGSQTVRNINTYQYFDNGLVKSSTDPWGISTSYTYNAMGQQTTQTITSAGGDMSRTTTSTYYPDGKQQSLSDAGVPTGLYSELVDNSDFNNASPNGNWTTSSGGSGHEGYDYATHAAGSGSDSFTWSLNIPEDGNYTVYVKYPVVSGAATNAQYTVNYSDGTPTGTTTAAATVDQTQNNNNGWVTLGKWAFTQDGAGQKITLAENSGGTVTADAVKVVRDDSSDTNTAIETFGYSYDPNGNLSTITDTSPGTQVPTYQMTYDGLNELTKVAEDNSSGTAVHTTTYGYDAARNMTALGHDSAMSTYVYDPRNLLTKETDAQSPTDPSPQVTTFTYTPDQQQATKTKPNGNTVTSAYYANDLLHNQTEVTSGGTLVSSHAYSYDPNANKTQDVEQLMSADNNAADLSHTLTYSYDPRDRIQQVTKDGTVTESYVHDAEDNVTSQTVNGNESTFNYDRNRLLSSMAGGVTGDYNYDPIGRLDTVTTGGQVTERNTYDGFDRTIAHQQLNSSGGLDTTDYTYDPLNRQTSQTTQAGTGNAKTTSYQYLGLTKDLVSELQNGTQTKSYTYDPYGQRQSQITDNSNGTTTPGYYSYNDHSDVEAVTGNNGNTTATYGYTAYGSNDTSMFTGADKNNANPSSTTTPYNAYRYNAMRWDSSSGQYDMGFRNYSSSLNQFLSRDMYNGALSDMALDTDPFTGNRYAFGAGNPLSNIELDGHRPDCGDGPDAQQCMQGWEKGQLAAMRAQARQWEAAQAQLQQIINLRNAWVYFMTHNGLDFGNCSHYTNSMAIKCHEASTYGNLLYTLGSIPPSQLSPLGKWILSDAGNVDSVRDDPLGDAVISTIATLGLLGPEEAGVGAAEGATSAAINTGDVAVYTSVDAVTGEVNYVGITNNLVRRAAQHLASKGITINGIVGLGNLSRADAKAVEQVLIEEYGGAASDGGSQLLNKINSIARTNPVYAQSIQRGCALLAAVGYPAPNMCP